MSTRIPFSRVALLLLTASFLCASVCVATVDRGSIPASVIKAYLEAYALLVIPSSLTVDVPSDGKYGVWAGLNPITGKTVTLTAVGGGGKLTVTDGGANGPCFVVGAFRDSPVEQNTAGVLNYYQVNGPPADQLPADEASANAMFLQLFGNQGALAPWEKLSGTRKDRSGKVVAFYYASTTAATVVPRGQKKPAFTMVAKTIKAICLQGGRVLAIYANGAGAKWSSFDK